MILSLSKKKKENEGGESQTLSHNLPNTHRVTVFNVTIQHSFKQRQTNYCDKICIYRESSQEWFQIFTVKIFDTYTKTDGVNQTICGKYDCWCHLHSIFLRWWPIRTYPPEGCFKASIHIGTPMVIPTSALHYDLLVTTLRGITTACCTKWMSYRKVCRYCQDNTLYDGYIKLPVTWTLGLERCSQQKWYIGVS